MDNIDHIINEELKLFHEQINSSSLVTHKLHSYLKDVSVLKNNLELISDYINRKDYLPAYKIMLTTLESLLTINRSILEIIENSKIK